FAGVLAGAANPAGARAFIDFLLSPTAQQDVPLEMFVYPAVAGTTLPDAFTKWAHVAPDPLGLDPAVIEQNRERWINQWTDTVVPCRPRRPAAEDHGRRSSAGARRCCSPRRRSRSCWSSSAGRSSRSWLSASRPGAPSTWPARSRRSRSGRLS